MNVLECSDIVAHVQTVAAGRDGAHPSQDASTKSEALLERESIYCKNRIHVRIRSVSLQEFR